MKKLCFLFLLTVVSCSICFAQSKNVKRSKKIKGTVLDGYKYVSFIGEYTDNIKSLFTDKGLVEIYDLNEVDNHCEALIVRVSDQSNFKEYEKKTVVCLSAYNCRTEDILREKGCFFSDLSSFASGLNELKKMWGMKFRGYKFISSKTPKNINVSK